MVSQKKRDKPLKRAQRQTVDHRTPKAWGGDNARENLRLVHAICNEYRGDGTNYARLEILEKALETDDCVQYLLQHRLRTQRERQRIEDIAAGKTTV